MKHQLNIKNEHLIIVKNILKQHITDAVTIWLFGSRVTNNSKPYSDLDIALEDKTNHRIDLKTLTKIQSDFIESDLPWKVDVIDYDSTSGIFRDNINLCKIELK